MVKKICVLKTIQKGAIVSAISRMAGSGRNTLPRAAFRLRIKAGAIDGYERDHKKVWPELLAKLKAVGISDYSIFRRGQDLFLVMRVADFEAAWRELEGDPVNLRWQQEMDKYFESVPDLQPGERVAVMKEVFYME
jgi:L-rhamnose mutarotase